MSETTSFAQQALAAVEAAILGRATSAILEQEVDGVKLKYMSMEQLLLARDKFKLLVAEESEDGICLPGSVSLEFR